MWSRLSSWTTLTSQLSTLASLLREQNGLLRELIRAQTGRRATTPMVSLADSRSSTASPMASAASPPRLPRSFTADDVVYVTPERRAHIEHEQDVAERQRHESMPLAGSPMASAASPAPPDQPEPPI